MKHAFLYAITAAFLALSCNEVKIEAPVQYGKISLSLSEGPAIEVETKAGEYTELTAQQAAGYNIYIYRNQACTDLAKGPIEYEGFGTYSIEVGTYYIMAENYTPTEAETVNDIRLLGVSNAVEVQATEQPANAVINCDVANALVTVSFDDSVYDENGDSRYENLKVSLKASGGSTKSEDVVAPSQKGQDIMQYFNPCTLTYDIIGKSKLGNDIEFAQRTVDLTAGTHIKLVVKVNTDNGQLSTTYTVNTTIPTTEKPETEGFNPYK